MDPTARSVLGVAQSVLEPLDLEVVLRRVLHAARDLTGARYAALGVLDESCTSLARFVTVGIDEAARRRIGPLPRGRGVLGELIGSSLPLRLSDVGAHPRSYGFPAGHPPMKTFLGVPVLVAGTAYGNLYLTDKADGVDFTRQDEDAVVLLAGFAGVAIDHARRFSGSEARRDELERTVATLDTTQQITRALGGQTDIDTILELVAKRGRALVSARAVVIELIDGAELLVAAGAGDLPAGLVGRRVPLADTVAGAALRTSQPQRLEDELTCVRFDQHGVGALGLRAAGGLVVPLVFQNHTYGALVAVDRIDHGPAFTKDDERLLDAFATSAAMAVATAESVGLERRSQRIAAAEAERTRWARELHDETLQGMAALCLNLATARSAADAAVLDDAVVEAIGVLEAEIAGLRALISDLRPAALDELGAEAAIAALAARTERTGLQVDVAVDLARGRHAPELEAAIYRIVQEGLTNAGRHGGARRAVVEVVEDGDVVVVVVRDDGTGFDPGARSDGFGLVGMRERAELLGGSVEVDSGADGTTVRASLPAGVPGPSAASRSG